MRGTPWASEGARRYIAVQITTERDRKNLTQKELARLIERSQKTVTNIETGHSATAATYGRIEDALGWPRGIIDSWLRQHDAGESRSLPAVRPVQVPTVPDVIYSDPALDSVGKRMLADLYWVLTGRRERRRGAADGPTDDRRHSV